MAIDPGAKQDLKPWITFTKSEDIPDWITNAYVDSYRGPRGGQSGTPETGGTGPADPAAMVTPAMLRAHYRLGQCRPERKSCVCVHPADDPDGFGPALQVVTDHGGMLLDSVTVLLHRLGVGYAGIMAPVFDVRRGPSGDLLGIEPTPPGASQYDGEAWIYVQLSPSVDSKALAEVERLLPKVLTDVEQVATDAAELITTLGDLAAAVETNSDDRFSAPDRGDVAELLRWLGNGNFLLLGYQHCRVHDGLVSGDGSTSLGVLRTRTGSRPRLTDDDHLLVLAQSVVGSYLRYGAYPYVIAVREFVEDADPGVIEHRFVGLFTVAAMNADVLEIPMVSRRVREALAMADSDPIHPGQLLLDVIQTVPRSELFTLSAERLLAMAKAVVDLGSDRRALLFLRADRLQYFVSCLVYVPRDRYTTAVRLQIEDILVHEFGGTRLEFTARVSESPWALMHFMVRLPQEDDTTPAAAPVDVSEANRIRIQRLLSEAARTWGDRLIAAIAEPSKGGVSHADAEHYATAFSEVYKQAVTPTDAIEHIAIINGLTDDSVKLVFSDRGEDGIAQLTWFLGGHTASLSQLLPMLQSMGVVVLEERPFTVTRPDGLPVWIYQFKIQPHPTISLASTEDERDSTAERFADAVTAIWQGRVEIDRFNELVMRARLTWQQVVLMRAYAKYLRQAGFPYSQSHIESVLNEHPSTVRSLVTLFEALFDPKESGPTSRDAQAAAAAVAADIDALVSLDTDRILRAFASLVQATLRTNYFVTREGSARARNVLAIKLDAQLVDELPLPRPKYEIFVYSPRVEGVHLRFGPVARGGLRWSDRRDDFRTEILGLVKAQAVKNAVIVPVGAKGGFVLKRPPLPTGDTAADRDATRAEGVACYQLFISGLLDVTDNVDHATGNVSPPPEVVRRDGDDAYLVVAADKGTATFSDIANDVAKSYGFWLGDAFASGGSVGYDHKAMGITAKGAWEAVKRHFREMGVDTQAEDFTVVGIGDMSGDVFGNGMLLSKHIRLLAAFDHRHIFLDPDPDAAASWEERRRMFDLPRSSWDDYDKSLISEGGGVYSREHKAIPVSPRVRDALGIDGPADEGVTEMSPPELIKAILQAPVDLLFNGGIGTYIKAESESDADVGDRANDPVRVNGNQVRAKVIGEGGNLGVTARGRVEFDLSGGRINTDAMDNSAGVDCSDHEVNIKILIDSLVTAGKVEAGERKALLESMTDEVAQLVLADNEEQNDLIGTSRANAASLLPVHAMQIKYLEGRGLNRELEALPSEKEIHRRTDAGMGLTSPELCTLMAHVKLSLKEDMLTTELPEQDVFASRLPQYFPTPLRERFTPEIRTHQLRREIVTTMLVNDLVDAAGISYAFRITEDVGVGPIDAVRTYAATDAIFGVGEIWRQIRAANLPVAVSDRLTLDTRRLIDRAGRWLLNYRPQPLAVGAEINRFAAKVKELTPRMSEWLRGDDKAIVEKEAADFASQGAPKDLAYMVAAGLYRYSLLDIIDIGDITEIDTAEVADTYFALMDRLGTDALLTAVSELPRLDRWQSLARLAIRDDIYASVRSLCFDVLAVGEPDESGEEKIAEWEHISASRVERARRTLTEIQESGAKDLATLSVAARQIRRMTRTSGRGSSS
ncbi:NAD-glutamate dehydrogenase [Mycobacterium heidelbergense]|uniref:NAD-glutamate dehydrogenase n=1 Tax=Mycobacterium heidelbergense TaxID=53376 RepID=A0A1X0DVZ2_MYCHE|nr:NAD-glutamate dehydrogenase [Mycobacterium heidelbergense]MCV7050013.1 NAD-glutamate dehydrogenase [Mycobacterium heidelbergense]ORA76583.1 NAD-glutamate dehydrogenase [Mycobacterium heidelbergense]BBZ51806.1 NAD-specific glutamate dehydrogenase [Mycobacterium heidelbergense]